MELVYLWVEEYKNIHKQGFNFSPKFICDYDGETLTIKDNVDEKGKKQYIENFFGDNINVTAIVGKNGSGKSSVLELVFDMLLPCFNNPVGDNCKSKCIICFKEHENITIYTNINLNNYDKKYKLNSLSQEIGFGHFFTTLYFDLNITTNNYTSTNNMIDISSSPFKDAGVSKGIYHLTTKCNNKKDLINLFFSNYRYESLKNIYKNVFYTKKIKLEIFLIRFLNKSIKEQEKNIEIFLTIDNPVQWLKNIITVFIESYEEQNKLANVDKEKFFLIIDKIIKNTKIELIVNHIDVLKTWLNEKEKDTMSGYVFDAHSKPQCEIYLSFNNPNSDALEIKNFFEYLYSVIDFNIVDFDIIGTINNQNISYNNLSDGYKTLIQTTSSLAYLINEKKPYNILVVFDEVFGSYHPNWQKRILQFLIESFKNTINIHFLITTHSPFLLSDIPKQNIIFLDTYKEEDGNQNIGNCRVISHNEALSKKQTFGANIHTLLSDSFFMEDGLMGEFAKGKINEVIDYLNGNNTKIKSDEEAQKLINIIGEPIVKNQLQRILDSKRLSKVDDIDELKSSMAEMQKRIDELEQ